MASAKRITPTQINRVMAAWLYQFPNKPEGLKNNFEYLLDGVPNMALSTIQGTVIVEKYILGGYKGQYQFKVIYRAQPTTNNERLKMDEFLDELGNWAATREDLPVLGDGARCIKIDAPSQSTFFARYENGDEDHQILMNMFYEVI